MTKSPPLLRWRRAATALAAFLALALAGQAAGAQTPPSPPPGYERVEVERPLAAPDNLLGKVLLELSPGPTLLSDSLVPLPGGQPPPMVPLADSLSEAQQRLLFLDTAALARARSQPLVPAYAQLDKKLEGFLGVAALVLSIALVFLALGFLIAIADFNVRDMLLTSDLRVYLFFGLVLAILALLARLFGFLASGQTLFLFGLVVGVAASLLTLRLLKANRDENARERP